MGDEFFYFTGGDLNVKIYYGGREIQELTMNFPSYSTAPGWPVPAGEPQWTVTQPPASTQQLDPTTWAGTDESSPGFAAMNDYYWNNHGTFYPDRLHRSAATTAQKPTPWTYDTSLQAAWSFSTRLAWACLRSENPLTDVNRNATDYLGDRWRCIVQPGDTIRTVYYGQPLGTTAAPTLGGDLRIASINQNVTGYTPHPNYNSGYSRACMLRAGEGSVYFPVGAKTTPTYSGGAAAKSPVNSSNLALEATFGNHVSLTGKMPPTRAFANLPAAANNGAFVTAVHRSVDNKPGDFDTGIGNFADGPYVNKPDEGNVITAWQDKTVPGLWYYPIPYYHGWAYEEPGNTYTSPFRQMPSAVMFGSLPRRPADKNHWETLCFTPHPAGASHPGNAVEPKDHYLLDLFNMPIVEPYPISEPLSTAGKVNLNYPIMPFDYITRSTALRAVLHAVRVTGVPKSAFTVYKTGTGSAPSGTYDNDPKIRNQAPPSTDNYRIRLDRNKTLGLFETYFDKGRGATPSLTEGFFKSASQICEMELYPLGNSDPASFWSNRTLTGDNVREKPYADMYPRITTKSNTYTVHMRVQTLRQLPRADGDFSTWKEGKDVVLGEYRGATTIERYIDPADPRFTPGHKDSSGKDDSVDPDLQSVEALYRFRSVINKKFTPQ